MSQKNPYSTDYRPPGNTQKRVRARGGTGPDACALGVWLSLTSCDRKFLRKRDPSDSALGCEGVQPSPHTMCTVTVKLTIRNRVLSEA